MTDYFDLGNYQRSITSESEDAIKWFNLGLVWCYAFNQEEAARCFQRVIDSDPECAMGYWGVAYANGPFYNKPWHWYGDQERPQAIRLCHHYANLASQHADKASPVEQALIRALLQKHPVESCDDLEIMRQWMLDYANAMREVYRQFNTDMDVICLFAEAIMNLTPWKLWDLHRGVPAPGSCTEEAIEVLEYAMTVMDKQQPHPGLLHFYIHIYEMSPHPEKALIRARQLTGQAPEAGHLLHMASHILSLCGLWQESIGVNSLAIHADYKYISQRSKKEFYMISVLHNMLYKMWAAMFIGRYERGLKAARTIAGLIDEEVITILGDRYLPSTIEAYRSEYVHLLIRFGFWQEVVDEPLPEKPDLYPITTIMLMYGKAISNAALGDIEAGRLYQKKFNELFEQIPDWHISHNNKTRKILEVAREMMAGEVDYHAGNVEKGFDHLRKANRLHDNLVYCEPWAWMHPPRHALGALLLEQGQIEEAIMHYEDDLGIGNRMPRCVQHPDNIWALHGYHECLNRLGRYREAEVVFKKLDPLMQQADFVVSSSCCCRGMNASRKAS